MASNTSQRKTQHILLAALVQEYSTWTMLVMCAPCRQPRSIPLAELPPDLTIMAVLLRMRCRSCKGKVAAALLDNGLPG